MKKCLRCGKCCQTSTLLKESPLWVKITRMIIIILRYKSIKMLFRKPRCPYLVFENRLAKCLIYEKRPQFCRDYFCGKC